MEDASNTSDTWSISAPWVPFNACDIVWPVTDEHPHTLTLQLSGLGSMVPPCATVVHNILLYIVLINIHYLILNVSISSILFLECSLFACAIHLLKIWCFHLWACHLWCRQILTVWWLSPSFFFGVGGDLGMQVFGYWSSLKQFTMHLPVGRPGKNTLPHVQHHSEDPSQPGEMMPAEYCQHCSAISINSDRLAYLHMFETVLLKFTSVVQGGKFRLFIHLNFSFTISLRSPRPPDDNGNTISRQHQT